MFFHEIFGEGMDIFEKIKWGIGHFFSLYSIFIKTQKGLSSNPKQHV